VLNITVTDMQVLVAFWLTFTRWLAVMFQIPLFDNLSVPTIVKVLGTLVITYAFFPFVQQSVLADVKLYGPDAFWWLTAFHAIAGLIIGFLVKSIMLLFTAAGSMITQQVGFSAIQYFDPQSGGQAGPFEKLIQWTILIMVVSSGALLPMFKGITLTFFSIQASSIGNLSTSPDFFVYFFKSLFMGALLLSAPLIFMNLLINSILGIVSRSVPQMNIIMVSFVVNIGMGLLVFAATSNEFFQVGFKLYTERLGDWFQFVS